MELTTVKQSETLNHLKLSGRLDTPGVDGIEARFNAMSVAGGRNAIVDMTEVAFITSMGIRMLVTAAKTAASRQRKFVLLNPQCVVDEYMNATDLYSIIPMARTLEEAEALCAGG